MAHLWDSLDTDVLQPGILEDCGHGVADLFGTDPKNPTLPDDDEFDELNVYNEDDDEFEEDDE